MAAADTGPADQLPGLAVLALLALLAHAIGTVVPLVDPLIVAIALGVLLANVVGIHPRLRAGIDRHGLLLELAIVLLGASVPLADLLGLGPVLIGLVVATVVVGIAVVETVSRYVLDLSPERGSLLAAGASVCGVSAVAAVASSIDADRETVAYVAGAILLFDAVTLVTVPVLGALLGLSDAQFGVWAGLVMFSTGPVTAAGFAYSPAAGQWAAVTKLLRNAAIAVLVVGYALVYADRDTAPTTRARLRAIPGALPGFLVGFLAVLAVANAGVLSPAGLEAVRTATEWLFALAFVGVGASIRPRSVRSAGVAPIVGLLAYLAVVGSLALLAVTAWL